MIDSIPERRHPTEEACRRLKKADAEKVAPFCRRCVLTKHSAVTGQIFGVRNNESICSASRGDPTDTRRRLDAGGRCGTALPTCRADFTRSIVRSDVSLGPS